VYVYLKKTRTDTQMKI